MKTDGPTLNEISSIDTTGNVFQDEDSRAIPKRPVSNRDQIKQWWNDSGKQIVFGVVVGIIVAIMIWIFGDLVYHHNIRLTEHDKDIEYFQKNELKQDGEIELLKEKSNEMNIDIRLIEQRIELETEKSPHPQIETNNK